MASVPPSPVPALPYRIEPLGDRALLVVLGETVDPEVNDWVHRLAAALAERRSGITDLVPSYASLAVHYDPVALTGPDRRPFAVLSERIEGAWRRLAEAPAPEPRVVRIPVRYGGQAGPDLADLARYCRLTEAEVIARHSAPEYRVYLLGFTPGFPYMGGIDRSIAAPRLDTPRAQVPAGSVGIAGLQTGIYPLATPGGWRIIGRTPCRMFDPALEPPCRLRPGDRIRFLPIDEDAYQAYTEIRP